MCTARTALTPQVPEMTKVFRARYGVYRTLHLPWRAEVTAQAAQAV